MFKAQVEPRAVGSDFPATFLEHLPKDRSVKPFSVEQVCSRLADGGLQKTVLLAELASFP